MLGEESKGASQHIVNRCPDHGIAVVAPGHEAVVHLGVVVALRSGVVTLQGFEPLTSGVVVRGVALRRQNYNVDI